jgi:hypothetical protein
MKVGIMKAIDKSKQAAVIASGQGAGMLANKVRQFPSVPLFISDSFYTQLRPADPLSMSSSSTPGQCISSEG